MSSSKQLTDEEILKLITQAFDMLPYAYTPYSHHKVGAALLANNGNIYGGCNIENAAFTPTSCAERTAICKAVSEGVTEFKAVAVVGGMDGQVTDYCAPCGVCRQVLREFCDPMTFLVILAKSPQEYRIFTLNELLPESFGPENIARMRR